MLVFSLLLFPSMARLQGLFLLGFQDAVASDVLPMLVFSLLLFPSLARLQGLFLLGFQDAVTSDVLAISLLALTISLHGSHFVLVDWLIDWLIGKGVYSRYQMFAMMLLNWAAPGYYQTAYDEKPDNSRSPKMTLQRNRS